MALQILESSFKYSNAMLAHYPDFNQFCIEVFPLFAEVGIVM